MFDFLLFEKFSLFALIGLCALLGSIVFRAALTGRKRRAFECSSLSKQFKQVKYSIEDSASGFTGGFLRSYYRGSASLIVNRQQLHKGLMVTFLLNLEGRSSASPVVGKIVKVEPWYDEKYIVVTVRLSKQVSLISVKSG